MCGGPKAYVIDLVQDMCKKIFIVDDEKRIRDLIRAYLEKEGYETRAFSNADSALEEFNKNGCDMLVIDIMMPGTDGLELCKKIRAGSDVPIIIVSARDEEIDRILGLELGSDDYLAKPFSPRELVIRIKNIFRRIAPSEKTPESSLSEFGNVSIDDQSRAVRINGTEIEFTVKEYELLSMFVKNPGRAYSREQLINSIWGYDYIGDVRPVDDLVKRIRKKLKAGGSTMGITTVWGFGYKSSEEQV